jgi:hypothetical protein
MEPKDPKSFPGWSNFLPRYARFYSSFAAERILHNKYAESTVLKDNFKNNVHFVLPKPVSI